jgi:hypothetical protein
MEPYHHWYRTGDALPSSKIKGMDEIAAAAAEDDRNRTSNSGKITNGTLLKGVK